jgi:hypothetical protein
VVVPCRILQPRQHFSDGLDVPRDLIIPDAHVDSAIPKPAETYVNLGIVDLLKFSFQRSHALIFALERRKAKLLKSCPWHRRPENAAGSFGSYYGNLMLPEYWR